MRQPDAVASALVGERLWARGAAASAAGEQSRRCRRIGPSRGAARDPLPAGGAGFGEQAFHPHPRPAIDRDHGADLHPFGTFGNGNRSDDAFIDGFKFHRRLVGFDLGKDVAGGDAVAHLYQPFGKSAFLHRRGKRGHLDFVGIEAIHLLCCYESRTTRHYLASSIGLHQRPRMRSL